VEVEEITAAAERGRITWCLRAAGPTEQGRETERRSRRPDKVVLPRSSGRLDPCPWGDEEISHGPVGEHLMD
jgi:hypothetical protein